MHSNFIDPKIEIFSDFRVFVLGPIPKTENLEVTEIHEKTPNTEIWECNFKNPLNAVQMTSLLYSLSYIFMSYFCPLRVSDPSRFIQLSLVYFSFNLK